MSDFLVLVLYQEDNVQFEMNSHSLMEIDWLIAVVNVWNYEKIDCLATLVDSIKSYRYHCWLKVGMILWQY